MKLTNKQLKKIIKEEISSVLNEAQNNQIKIGDEEIKAGKEMQNTPIGNAIFKQLLKDPKVKKRLKKAYDYAKKRKEASKRKTKRRPTNIFFERSYSIRFSAMNLVFRPI